jgi:hypothetical protein
MINCKRCGELFDEKKQLLDSKGDFKLPGVICDRCAVTRLLQFIYTDEELLRLKDPEGNLVFPNGIPKRGK